MCNQNPASAPPPPLLRRLPLTQGERPACRCSLPPAGPWIFSEADDVPHNEEDDLMALNVGWCGNHPAIFISQRGSCGNVSLSTSHMRLRSKGTRKRRPRQLFRSHLERNEGCRFGKMPLKSSPFLKDERVSLFHNSPHTRACLHIGFFPTGSCSPEGKAGFFRK